MSGKDSQAYSRRRWIKAAGATGVVGLAGCLGIGSDDTNASGDEVHFVTDETSDSSKEFWDRVAADFEEATGTSTQMEYVGGGTSGVQRITQLIQANDPPEIFTMNAADASEFKANGILNPVDGVLESLTDTIGAPDDQAQVTIDDQQWLVPLWYNKFSFHYRDDVSDIVPDTWDKALEYAREVDEEVDGIRGTYVPAGTGDHVSYRLMGWLFSKDASMMEWEDDQIKVAYDEGDNRDAMVDVLTYLKERYQYSPDATDSTYTTNQNAIPSGSAASTTYIGFRPAGQAAMRETSFSENMKRVSGMPTPEDGSGMTCASIDGMGTFQGANREAAETFMEFVLQEEYLIDLYMALSPVHNSPVYPELRNSEEYQDEIDNLSDAWPMDTIESYLDESNLKVRIEDTDPPNPYAGASYTSEPVWGLQQDVLVNDMNPEEAIDKWAPEHQQIVDQAQN